MARRKKRHSTHGTNHTVAHDLGSQPLLTIDTPNGPPKKRKRHRRERPYELKEFQCYRCRHICDNEAELLSHANATRHYLECGICHELRPTPVTMSEHLVRYQHMMQCETCGVWSPRIKNWRKHFHQCVGFMEIKVQESPTGAGSLNNEEPPFDNNIGPPSDNELLFNASNDNPPFVGAPVILCDDLLPHDGVFLRRLVERENRKFQMSGGTQSSVDTGGQFWGNTLEPLLKDDTVIQDPF